MSIKHAVLGLLRERPMHGYAVRSAFEKLVGDVWELNYGQVYQVLTALQREGLIAGTKERVGNRPERTVYAITSAGSEVLRKWLNAAPAAKRLYRDDFYVRLLFLQRAGDLAALSRTIDGHIEAAQEYLATLVERQSAKSDPISRLLAKAAILHAQADYEALTFCRSHLAPAQRNGTPERTPARTSKRAVGAFR